MEVGEADRQVMMRHYEPPTMYLPASWGINSGALFAAEVGAYNAMTAALHKHGRPTRDPIRGAVTLLEEAGEVAAAALDATRASTTPEEETQHLQEMCEELAQVAGYAMLLIMSMRQLILDERKERE